jgi:hypothetical protein
MTLIEQNRLVELAEQAIPMMAGADHFNTQAETLGVDPDALIGLYETIARIADELELGCEAQMSYAFAIGVLVGREQ